MTITATAATSTSSTSPPQYSLFNGKARTTRLSSFSFAFSLRAEYDGSSYRWVDPPFLNRPGIFKYAIDFGSVPPSFSSFNHRQGSSLKMRFQAPAVLEVLILLVWTCLENPSFHISVTCHALQSRVILAGLLGAAGLVFCPDALDIVKHTGPTPSRPDFLPDVRHTHHHRCTGSGPQLQGSSPRNTEPSYTTRPSVA